MRETNPLSVINFSRSRQEPPGRSNRPAPPFLLFWLAVALLAASGLVHSGRAQTANPPPLALVDKLLVGEYRSIAVSDPLAFIGNNGYFLTVDVAGFAPRILNHYILPGLSGAEIVEDIALDGDYAYLALGESGLRALDISDPLAPVQVWQYGPGEGFSGRAVQVDADSGRLYAAADEGGLYIFSLTAQFSPVLESVWTESAHVRDVLGREELAYIGTIAGSYFAGGKVIILDVQDPGQPLPLGEIEFRPGSYTEGFYALEARGSLIYAVHADEYTAYGMENTLVIIDASDPSAPQEVSAIELGGYYDDEYEIALDYPFAYISGNERTYSWGETPSNGHLFTVYVSDPVNPTILGVLHDRAIYDAAISGESVYVAGHELAIGKSPILSAADVFKAALTTTREIEVEETGYNLILTTRAGLQALRSEPGSASIKLGFGGSGLETAARYVLPFGWSESYFGLDSAVRIYDSNSSPPLQHVGVVGGSTFSAEDFYPEGAWISGDLLYVIEHAKISVADVSNPAEPVPITRFNSSFDVQTSVMVVDSYVYVGTFFGFQVYDFSDPFNPFLAGGGSLPETVLDFDIAGNHLYAVSGSGRMDVFDITDPTSPVHGGTLDTPGTSSEIEVKGPYAFIADGPGGLRIVDISNPAAPVEIAAYDNVLDATQVAVDRSTIWLLDPDGLLFRFRFGHSVYGSVYDIHGNPVVGVNVISDLADSRSTNWAGNFSFNFLNPGALTITPILGEHTFYPASRSATVPPDAGSQTFIMLGPPASVAVSPVITSTLTFTDTQGLPTTAVFPPGSVAIAGTAYLTPTLAAPFPGQTFAFHAFDLDFPAPESCAVPIELAITYSELDQSAVSDPSAVALWWLGPSGWAQVSGGVISTIGDGFMLGVEICTPGRYALFGPSNLLYFPVISE